MAGDVNGCPAWESKLVERAWAQDALSDPAFDAHLCSCPRCSEALEAERALCRTVRDAARMEVPRGVTEGLAREVFARTTREELSRRQWLASLFSPDSWGKRSGWAAALTAAAAGLVAVTMPNKTPVTAPPSQPEELGEVAQVPDELLDLTDVDLELLEELEMAEDLELLELLDLIEELDDV